MPSQVIADTIPTKGRFKGMDAPARSAEMRRIAAMPRKKGAKNPPKKGPSRPYAAKKPDSPSLAEALDQRPPDTEPLPDAALDALATAPPSPLSYDWSNAPLDEALNHFSTLTGEVEQIRQALLERRSFEQPVNRMVRCAMDIIAERENISTPDGCRKSFKEGTEVWRRPFLDQSVEMLVNVYCCSRLCYHHFIPRVRSFKP